MKLLVVSHACITPVNQSFYAAVAEETGCDITLIVPATWTTEYSATAEVVRWHAFKGTIRSIPVWKPGNIPLHVYKTTMIAVLRAERPDAIYVHHEPYGLATVQIYLANRMVDRCPIGFYTAQNIYKTYPPPFGWLEHYVLKTSAFCFPVTDGALEVLRRKKYEGKATVLALPIDKSIYYPDPVGAAEWRSKLSIAPDDFVLGYLGRLVEEKGLTTLLHALATLKEKNWRCVLAGSGPAESQLRALVATLGLEDKVIFAGFIPHTEAPPLMSMFDVLVLPSETRRNWKEQFGRVIIEANACGTAVIGTDSGEIANVLRKTGGGIVVPEASVPELSDAILRLKNNPELVGELSRTGAKAAYELYDQSQLARQFASTISNALTKGGL